MEKIAVIGDSHVNFFGGNELISFTPITDQNRRHLGMNTSGNLIDNFSTFHLGPAFAYNLNKYETTNHTREKIELLMRSGLIKQAQPILCCFGEIDCRVHVLRQAEKQNVDYRVVVNDIANNCINFLLRLRKEHPIYVWGTIPTQKDGSPDNPEFPHYGTEVDRNLATGYLNEVMRDLCARNGITFLSIFEHLIDSNNKTREEFIADGCHLSQKAWTFALDEFRRAGIEIKFGAQWRAHSFNTSLLFNAREPSRADEIGYVERIRKKLRVMDPINMSFIRVDAANRRGFVMVRERLERVAIYDFTARNQSFLAGNRNPLQPKHVLLSDVISMNGHAEARNLVLKLELDGGCEYNVLHTVGEKTLDQFEQIAIVFHGLTEPPFKGCRP